MAVLLLISTCRTNNQRLKMCQLPQFLAVRRRTGELVKQKLHRADVEVQLVHMMLTKVANLKVSGKEKNVLTLSEGK